MLTMRPLILTLTLILLATTAQAVRQSQHVAALSTDRGMLQFQKVIDSKCTLCHTRTQIDKALSQQQDIDQILAQMIGHGAQLTDAEKTLLSRYWNDAQFAEVNQVISLRCTGCHTRQRIDEALANGENLAEIREKMIRFGAQLSTTEQEVLGVFGGNPLK
jgi:uncharacterized membrane protein